MALRAPRATEVRATSRATPAVGTPGDVTTSTQLDGGAARRAPSTASVVPAGVVVIRPRSFDAPGAHPGKARAVTAMSSTTAANGTAVESHTR
jgi:hypothetical protein